MMPAFKFVFVFISLLLSDLLKAVHMPLVNAPKSIAAHCPEGIVRQEDQVRNSLEKS